MDKLYTYKYKGNHQGIAWKKEALEKHITDITTPKKRGESPCLIKDYEIFELVPVSFTTGVRINDS